MSAGNSGLVTLLVFLTANVNAWGIPQSEMNIAETKSLDLNVRMHAAKRLGNDQTSESLNRLLELLRDPASPVSRQATLSLGIRARGSSEFLLPYLDSSDDKTRAGVMLALALAKAEKVRPLLRKTLRDPPSAELWAAAAIGSAYMHEYDSTTVRMLAGVLMESDHIRGRGAKEALNIIAATDDSVIPLMVPLFSDENTGMLAVNVLSRVGKTGVPQLLDCLRSTNSYTRAYATMVIEKIGPSAEAAVPDIIRLLDDAEDFVRLNAIRALGAMGPPSKQAVPALVRVLSGRDDIHAGAAVYALIGIGPYSDPDVHRALEIERNPLIRTRLSAVIGMHSADPRERIPALLWDMAEQRNVGGGSSSRKEIDDMGQKAVPFLIEALNWGYLYRTAEEVLSSMKPFPEQELLEAVGQDIDQAPNMKLVSILVERGSPHAINELKRRRLIRDVQPGKQIAK